MNSYLIRYIFYRSFNSTNNSKWTVIDKSCELFIFIDYILKIKCRCFWAFPRFKKEDGKALLACDSDIMVISNTPILLYILLYRGRIWVKKTGKTRSGHIFPAITSTTRMDNSPLCHASRSCEKPHPGSAHDVYYSSIVTYPICYWTTDIYVLQTGYCWLYGGKEKEGRLS